MSIAIDPGKVTEHVLLSDQGLPEDQQTTWKIKTLTASQVIQATTDDSLVTSRNFCLIGLDGWENFLDQSGKVIIYPGEAAKAMRYMSVAQVIDVGGLAAKECTLSDEDRGKSTAG